MVEFGNTRDIIVVILGIWTKLDQRGYVPSPMKHPTKKITVLNLIAQQYPAKPSPHKHEQTEENATIFSGEFFFYLRNKM